MEPLDPLWTGFLEQLSRVVTPVWGDLIQYIPLLIVGGIIAILALVAWMWQRNAEKNRSRVPRPVPGRKPEGVHLPGPSPWPFVAPVGLVILLFGLAMGLESSTNLALIGLGLLIVVVGAIGWLWDARREYRQVEAGGHAAGAGGSAVALAPGGLGFGDGPGGPSAAGAAPAARIPAGIHLPGPSAWPFLAPIGIAVTLLGLVFGPAFLVGGIVMTAIAAIGWLRDAGREYRQVEAVGHAEPETRDPEKAFPKALGPLFVGVFGLAVLITALPALFSLLPTGGGDQAPALAFTPGTAEAPRVIPLQLTAALQIDDPAGTQVTKIVVKAGETVTFDVTNSAGFGHNFYIGTPSELSVPDATTATGIPTWETGLKELTWTVPASGALQYACTVPGHYALMHGDFDIVP